MRIILVYVTHIGYVLTHMYLRYPLFMYNLCVLGKDVYKRQIVFCPAILRGDQSRKHRSLWSKRMDKPGKFHEILLSDLKVMVRHSENRLSGRRTNAKIDLKL